MELQENVLRYWSEVETSWKNLWVLRLKVIGIQASVASLFTQSEAAMLAIKKLSLSCQCSQGFCQPVLLQGHVAGSHSTCFPPGSFSAKLLSSWSSVYLCLVLFLPQCGALQFSLFRERFLLQEFCQTVPSFSASPHPSGWQHSPQVYQPLLPVLCLH